MEEMSSRESMEASKATRNVADKKYLPAFKGIMKRVKKSEILPILLCEYKKEEVLNYLLSGELSDRLSNQQLLNRMVFGSKMTYGPANNRVTKEVSSVSNLEQLFNEVPEVEYEVENAKCKLCGKKPTIQEDGTVVCSTVECILTTTGYSAPNIVEWNSKMS